MLRVPVGRDLRLQIVTKAPDNLNEEPLIPTNASSVELRMVRPTVPPVSLSPIAGTQVLEGVTPIVGTYEAWVDVDAGGLWRGVWVYVIATKQYVVPVEFYAYVTTPAVA